MRNGTGDMVLQHRAPLTDRAGMTPAWWTALIVKAGYDLEVIDVQADKFGTGQLGENVRFTLEYASPSGAAPTTFVGKFPSANPGSLAVAKAYDSYLREVNFYRVLAPSVGISAPAMFHAEIDAAGEQFILIMEDLAPAKTGDQIKGLTVPQATLALEEAAKLHASHWSDPKMEGLSWLMGTKDSLVIGKPQMEGLWGAFLGRYGHRIDGASVDTGAQLVDMWDKYALGYRGPRCLVHNDYRPDNMMFASDDLGGRPITVVDWQSIGLGCAMTDIAYFLGGALPRDERLIHEDRLLRLYHDNLVSLGVKDYGFDRLRHDYARQSFQLLAMTIAISTLVEQTERGDAMFMATAANAVEFIKDVDGLSALRDH